MVSGAHALRFSSLTRAQGCVHGIKCATRLAIAFTLMVWAHVAWAAAGCTFVSAGPMTFTGYGPFSGAASASASVTVSCANNPSPAISVAPTPRTMTAAGAPALPFTLYTDAAQTIPWNASQKMAFAATANGQTTVTIIFGGIAAGQNVAAASYSSSVVVTLYQGNNPNPQDTITMTVQATVPPACQIGAGALAFGSYDPMGANKTANLDGQGSMGVQCTASTVYTLELNFGSHAAGSPRQMAIGANRLSYDLYTNASRTTVWSTYPAAVRQSNASSTAPVSIPVYGRIPAGQNVSGGAYQDLVTATLTY